MTRKDYIKIAQALARSRPIAHTYNSPENTPREVWDRIVNEISGVLLADNSRFDAMWFREACEK